MYFKIKFPKKSEFLEAKDMQQLLELYVQDNGPDSLKLAISVKEISEKKYAKEKA